MQIKCSVSRPIGYSNAHNIKKYTWGFDVRADGDQKQKINLHGLTVRFGSIGLHISVNK